MVARTRATAGAAGSVLPPADGILERRQQHRDERTESAVVRLSGVVGSRDRGPPAGGHPGGGNDPAEIGTVGRQVRCRYPRAGGDLRCARFRTGASGPAELKPGRAGHQAGDQ